MRILQLTNKVPVPPKDGGAIATLNLTKSFSELGHSVTMLSLNTFKHYCELSKLPKETKDFVDLHAVDLDTKISPITALNNLVFSKMPYIAVRFLSENYKNALIQLLQKYKYDVIQIEGLYMGLYIPTIKKYSDALIAMRAHNIEFEIWERTAFQEKNHIKKQYLKNLSKRIKKMGISILNSYDVLVPITARDGKVFLKYGSKVPLHVTPTGVDTQQLIPGFSNSEFPSLFHLGALDWSPNQEGLLWFLKNVWKTINVKYPNLKFYIAGRNAPNWFVKKIDFPNVEYVGEVEDAQKFMNSKALMVVPLLSGSGMRIKIIEGMALGKTIITTSIGTEGINTTHNENIIIANTPTEYVKEISAILENKRHFDRIGKNAVNFVEENFDNLSIAKSLLSFYNQQINRRMM